MKALLLSGGIESAAIAYAERPDVCLTINYGQPSALGEIDAARFVCKELALRHIVVQTNAYSAFLKAKNNIKSDDPWWPFRNQLLITIAAINLASSGLSELALGLVKDDIYRDCKPSFVDSMNEVALCQECPFVIVAPALSFTSLQYLRKVKVPVELLSLTFSCHRSDIPCGLCAGCEKNRKVQKAYKLRLRISAVV